MKDGTVVETFLLSTEAYIYTLKSGTLSTHSVDSLLSHYTLNYLGGFKKQHLGVNLVKEVGGEVHLRALIGLPVSVFVAPEQTIPLVCVTEIT